MIKIRTATAEDESQIYDLLVELRGDQPNRKKFSEIYLRDIENPNVIYLVAVDKRDIIGYICGSFDERIGHEKMIATIRGFVVTEKYRNHKIGSNLFTVFEKTASDNGCEKIEVISNILRANTHRFYENKGGMSKTHYKFSKELK